MFKNKIVIIVLVIAIIASAAGWYAYDRHQSALAAEKARQEELAKKNAEAKAYNDAKAAEEEKAVADQAAKDDMKLDDQGRGPLERELSEIKELTSEQQRAIKEAEAKLTPEEKAKREEAAKKDSAEFEAIVKMLTAYNKAQNDIDYRTITGLEGEKYIIPGTDFYKWFTSPERIAEIKKTYQDKKLVTAFDGINVRALRFTQDNFKYYSDDPYAPRTEAYAEIEIMSHDVEPTLKNSESDIWAVWVKKVNGEWKVYYEQRLKQ